MFKNTIKELNKLHKGGDESIPYNFDKEGYLDRECQNEECYYNFKIYKDDWEEKISEYKVHCPKCGHTATSDCWDTEEQIEAAGDIAFQKISKRLDRAMLKDAKEFNRSQPRNSFVSMRMTVKGNSNSYFLPMPTLEELEQKITCSQCDTRYAVIGSAFFCPCCGRNSAEETFDNTINIIDDSIKNLPVIKEAVSKINKDQAENTCNSLIETGISDCVTAFQRYCEVTYSSHPKKKKKITPNTFQRLDEGGKLWDELIGRSYSNWLKAAELKRLNILFQRRHLLQHTQEMVDQKYLDKTGDKKYKLNQKIVIKEKDVIEMIGYIKKLKKKIDSST